MIANFWDGFEERTKQSSSCVVFDNKDDKFGGLGVGNLITKKMLWGDLL